MYIPLRVKTSYSLLTSLIDIKKMILFCKEKGIKYIGICDTNMYGVMEFYKECIANDIKPIIGLEIKFEDSLLLLYAKNYSGYQNLTRLTYIIQEREVNIDDLKLYKDNLICITDRSDLDFYDDLYYGYTDINNAVNNGVYVNEILCFNKNDKEYLKYLYLIKSGKKINDDYYFEVSDNCYFDFSDISSDIKGDIVSKCNVEFKENKELWPKYPVDNSKEYLENLCKKGLYKRLSGKVPKSYYDRLLYELDIINKMGFNDYFLVVWDYVKYAKQNNILVGPGRGSAVSSLVAYSLGITSIDPLKYGLLFERFLNPERITMPDIDIDFEANRRDEVVNYVMNKYGINHVAPIITFTTLSGKQVLRDVGRIFNINVDNITKYIDDNLSNSKSKLSEYLDNPKIKNIYDIALKLEGLKRQISVHAAGVVISKCDLSNYIPLQKYGDYYLSGYSMEHLEGLGLIKMDFLSLKNLTTILNITNEVGIDFNNIDVNDKESLKIFTEALTCGIFQFESSGMKNFLRKLEPSSFDDIIAAIALFRPGPSNNIESYIRRKNGKEKVDYIDESLKDILLPTYGIIIYQEQIMQIANVMAGYSYGEADILRRAMSKKKKEILLSEREKFIVNSLKRGYKKEVVERVYDFILKFADYGFNKAHSVAYSIIAVKMAYLKNHYKKEFISSLLTGSIGNFEKTKEYIDEAKKMDMNILKPDINISEYKYICEEDGIRFSLASIKNVGVVCCKEIVKERENGKFLDFFDFVKRCYGKINKKTIECLIDSSVFDSFNYNHNTLYDSIDLAINYAELSHDLDESLIDKPIIDIKDEFSDEILSNKEKDVFGFYISNHPTTKYKLKYNSVIDISNIKEYFNKKVNIVGVINRINTTITKNNDVMAFIDVYDDTGSIDITIFPKVYDSIDLKRGDICVFQGIIEKRVAKYQLVLEKVKKLK